MPRRRDTNFQREHIIKFGLSIIERDLRTQGACAVRCRFCVFFGREEVIGEKRKRHQTENVKDFRSFSPELYRKHHEGQHSTRWKVYEKLTQAGKESYFDEKVQYKETITSHFGHTDHVYNINTAIVEKVIGDMFFHPDEKGSISRDHAMKLFAPNDHNYTVTIKNSLQFHLVIDYLASGLSFRQVENIYKATRKRTGMARIGSINDTVVSNYARVLCAINLQMLTDILKDKTVWAFSLANDSSTHASHSYFDNRIRFHRDGTLYNVHALAIPMFDRHNADYMFKLVSDFLDVICSEWRAKLIGVGTDGAEVKHIETFDK
jgi:hypothetical protein